MPRDRFKKVMFSPYFQTDHYQKTESGKLEKKIENSISKKIKILKNIFNKFRHILF